MQTTPASKRNTFATNCAFKSHLISSFCCWCVDGRRNGDDDIEHIGAGIALRLAAQRVAKSSHHNRKTKSHTLRFAHVLLLYLKHVVCELFQVVFCGMMLSGAIWGKMCDLYGRKAVSDARIHCIQLFKTTISNTILI